MEWAKAVSAPNIDSRKLVSAKADEKKTWICISPKKIDIGRSLWRSNVTNIQYKWKSCETGLPQKRTETHLQLSKTLLLSLDSSHIDDFWNGRSTYIDVTNLYTMYHTFVQHWCIMQYNYISCTLGNLLYTFVFQIIILLIMTMIINKFWHDLSVLPPRQHLRLTLMAIVPWWKGDNRPWRLHSAQPWSGPWAASGRSCICPCGRRPRPRPVHRAPSAGWSASPPYPGTGEAPERDKAIRILRTLSLSLSHIPVFQT
jgi:hypothetical protein